MYFPGSNWNKLCIRNILKMTMFHIARIIKVDQKKTFIKVLLKKQNLKKYPINILENKFLSLKWLRMN